MLLLSDRVDEWLVGHLTEFDGKQLKSVAKGGLDLGELEDEAEKTAQKKAEDEYKELVEKIKTALGERVKDVRVTHRLTDSPACLVAGEHDMSANLERLLKAAGQAAPHGQAHPGNQPEPSAGHAAQLANPTKPASPTGPTCCSSRPCWPKAASSTIRPASSSASTS